jgi:hypothetical protein
MKNEEAKFILRAYRPSGQDAADPSFASALDQARRDPALGAWLAAEQAHDGAVAQKVREIVPPPGLRSNILAGATVTRVQPGRRRLPAWLGLAAAVAVLITSTLVWLQPAHADEQALSEFALNFAAHPFRLAEHDDDMTRLRGWLSTRSAPLPVQLPVALTDLHRLGCRTVVYRGKNISLLCFEAGKEYHLFVARRSDFPELPAPAQLQLTAKAEWGAAHWADAENHYVLVSDAGMAAVKRLL